MSKWQTIALGKLIEPVKAPRAKDAADLPILSMTMHSGLVPQTTRFSKSIASTDTSTYKVVVRGDLVVGFPIDEGVLDFQTNYDAAIVSPAYGIWKIRNNAPVSSSYLGLFLRSPEALHYYRAKLRGSTARRRSLSPAQFTELQVPLPPLEEQRRIAALLSHSQLSVEAAGGKHQSAIALKNQAFSAFLKDLQADQIPLSEVASVQSGITKGRKIKPEMELIETPYLAVSNVKDDFLDLKKVSNIDATEAERERYRLSSGDILLTEGGDPDKLGRGTIWREEVPGSIHQNHIFRVRLPENSVYTPEALMAVLGSRESRIYFFRSAKQTTGIASINKSQLSNLPVPILSSELISQITEISHKAAEVIRGCALKVELAEELHRSLATRAFAGEL